ncbi:MAG: 2-isopropylmalate synthase [Candidatus Omnitrophica bacterium 4484_213]|nr:MAG: 2-isopropylmalate synthase [Candidatus Omnitrophica bacterium 4484_213]
MDKILIFDTTLRDGEQSPGASLTPEQKLSIAEQLARLNVDIIEAGYPASSPGEIEAIREICKKVKKPIIAGLARTLRKDIDCCLKALDKTNKPRLHIFCATSEIHLKYKLKKAKEEILRLTVESIRYARRFIDDIEFSPEDATRTDFNFLVEVVQAAIAAGATTINIPDTVGCIFPSQFTKLIKDLRQQISFKDVNLSVHCHNDLGLAVANSLTAVEEGANQVECTVNGIGERAGNASLEEVAMNIKLHPEIFRREMNIKTEELFKVSRLVSHLTGIPVQPNKAIVGSNAFAHEAGIHQDGILKKRTTYEIINPKDVGVKESRLVLGKHSGSHALEEHLKRMGYHLTKKEFAKFFIHFKQIADKKKEVFDEDLEIILDEVKKRIPQIWQLEYIHISSGNKTVPTATIRLKRGEEILEDSACGDGPIDACYKAIERITGLKGKLLDYSLQAITSGKDALGEVSIKVRFKDEIITARGASTDIIEASAKAYLEAVNRQAAGRKNKE